MFFQPASSQEKENFINFFVCKKWKKIFWSPSTCQ
jgi:hypothetical protein